VQQIAERLPMTCSKMFTNDYNLSVSLTNIIEPFLLRRS